MQASTATPSGTSVRGFIVLLRWVTVIYAVLALMGLAVLATEIPACIELARGIEDCVERSQYLFFVGSAAIASFFFVLFCLAVAYALELLADIRGVPVIQPEPQQPPEGDEPKSVLLRAAERRDEGER
jgi:hypothetical protein